MAKMYYDADANLNLLKGKTIGVMGFGSQGHAQAQNLKESGLNVVVGLRKPFDEASEKEWNAVIEAGIQPMTVAEAAQAADIIQILLPDEVQARVYNEEIKPYLKEGNALGFSHGFNIHYGQIVPPAFVDVFMVAPKSPGHLVRRMYVKGAGVPGLVAVQQNFSGQAKEIGLAYACGIGCTRAGVIETSFQEETETDLFGEQCVLCGGQLVVNDVRPIVDVDELGFPSIGDQGHYYIHDDKISAGDPQMGGFTYELTASRGCPFKCSYCSSINLRRIYKGKGKYVRFRSVDSVMAELNQAKKALPHLKVIHFWDEIFSNEAGWVEEFSQRYPREIGIPFRVWGHPLMINHRIISNLVEAGLYQIVVGIQSGSPRIRKEVFHRNESQEEIIKCSQVLAECKVPKVIYDFMIHHPFESLEELKETYRLCLELKPPFELQIHGLHFLPGTDIVQMALDAGYYSCEEMNAKMYGSLKEQFESWYWDVSASENIDEITCWTSMIFLTQFPSLRTMLKKMESNLEHNKGLNNIYRLQLIMNKVLKFRNLAQKAILVVKP